jgi:hypothetical protein
MSSTALTGQLALAVTDLGLRYALLGEHAARGVDWHLGHEALNLPKRN